MNNLIVTITGPSGSGKSTLEKQLKSKGLISLISTTTRQPRAGEVNGQHYYFVDKSEFKRLKEQGAFVEDVTFNDEYYGLYKSEVDKLKQMNSPAVIVVEPHGKAQVEKYAKGIGLNCMRVFIDVDPQVQIDRLLRRFRSDVKDLKEYDFRLKKLYDQTVAANAKRLLLATTEERDWVVEAYKKDEADGLINYDYIIKSFDAETEQLVVRQLENSIDSRLAKAPQLEAA